jgi:hypothetical protein
MGPPKRERRRAGNAAPDLKQVIHSDSTNLVVAWIVAQLQARMSRQVAGFGQPSLRGGGDDTAG